jgi:hypothetical protein
MTSEESRSRDWTSFSDADLMLLRAGLRAIIKAPEGNPFYQELDVELQRRLARNAHRESE